MIDRTVGKLFIAISLILFFVVASAYNLAYFGTLGDTLLYFLYIPMGFFDLIKTGLVASLLLFLFLLIFKNFLVDPPFREKLPNQKILLGAAILVLGSNLLYFIFFISAVKPIYSLLLELLIYTSFIVCFFGILYHFLEKKSHNLMLLIFFCSLIPISLLIGWSNAKYDIISSSYQTKSSILLKSNKMVSAKIIRSFDKGVFVMSGSSGNFGFVTWDEIKQIKFKKVGSL